jgi:hypothetical protein
MDTLLEKINDLSGYRIKESHFRIGSKIHVSDFYFAKRFFQNSYFASRLAFLIAKQILAESPGEEEFKQKGITLIGYGLYSELLLSLIERFLKPKVNSLVNHDIVDDADEPQLLRGYEPIHEYIAIVVPIASAFSTSMKIEDSLRSRPQEEFKDKTFLKSHFNILHVNHSGEETRKQREFIRTLGWRGEEKKSVKVRPFFADPTDNDEIRNERYLIRLPSRWHPVDDCELCFPEGEPMSEKPLFISDRSSVTPDLIFAYPKERKKAETGPFVIKPAHLAHGHLRQSKSHFRFYVRIEEFFRDNESRIEKWLKVIRQEMLKKKLLTDSDRVVIIAPAQFSNAAFVNKVNEVLCSDAATIIHYDPTNDDIQNFRIFYEREFRSNVKVFFVDDTITTGRTFLRTNYFIKHTRPRGDQETRGLDGVIVLLDRSDEFVFNNISRKLNTGEEALFTFAGLHIPLLRMVDNKCPLCLEHDRYIDLANRSYLDVTKMHLLLQAAKLVKSNSLIPTSSSILPEKKRRSADHNLKKIEAMFRIVEWFSQGNNLSSVSTFEDWMDRLMSEVHVPFVSSFAAPRSDEFISETAATVLKVMTYTQFTHFKPVRSKLFGWLLKLLDEKVRLVKLEIEAGNFTVSSLRELKFLMRRAGRLNSNFLISQKFFDLLKIMLSETALARLGESNDLIEGDVNNSPSLLITNTENSQPLLAGFSILPEKEPKPDWEKLLSEFVIFYVAQVKELCSVSDSRCVRLEKELQRYELMTDGFNPRFQQVVRFLKAENSIVIENFWELAKKQLISDENKIAEPDFNALYDNFVAHSHYRYQSLKGFLRKSDQTIRDDKELTAYLKMSLFFAQESQHKLNLQEKTRKIVDGLRSIVDHESNNGAFFIVRYKETEGETDDQKADLFNPIDHFVAYNRGVHGPINSSEIFSNNQKYLGDFFNGTHISNGKMGDKDEEDNKKFEFTASVIELHRDEAFWYDAYSASKVPVEIDRNFLPHANKLILIRFAAKELLDGKVADRPQGMVAIYYNKDQNRLFTSNKLRYLLLLRRSISNFILKHHNNAEFRDWIEADKERRIALLTGHGREMLLRFAASDNRRYFDIVQTILFVQRLIIDQQDESELFLRKQVKPENGEFSVIGTFEKLYLVEPDVIDKEYGAELSKMADEIFNSELVENKVSLSAINPNVPEDFVCRFPKKLLEMICFELFVNAKKNRWVFDSGEYFDFESERYDENRIWIEFKRDPVTKKVSIIIENTGPRVDDYTADSVFSNKEIKDYDSVAGTIHIKTLLETFNLGEVSFEQNPLTGDLWKITVTLKLRSWDE